MGIHSDSHQTLRFAWGVLAIFPTATFRIRIRSDYRTAIRFAWGFLTIHSEHYVPHRDLYRFLRIDFRIWIPSDSLRTVRLARSRSDVRKTLCFLLGFLPMSFRTLRFALGFVTIRAKRPVSLRDS